MEQVDVVAQVGGRAVEGQVAVTEHVGPVGDLEGEVDVLFDEHDGRRGRGDTALRRTYRGTFRITIVTWR